MKTHALVALALVLCVLSCPSVAPAASTIDYVDMDILVVIYLHYDSGISTTKDLTQTDIDYLEQELDGAREFYWRASGLNCNLNYNWSEQADLLIIGNDPGERTLTPQMMENVDGQGGLMLVTGSVDGQTSVIQDLADAGIQDGQYSVVIVFYALEPGDGYYSMYGAWTYYVDAVLGTACCMMVPVCWDSYESIIVHEYQHALDSIDQVCWEPLDILNPDEPHLYPYGMDGGVDFWFQNLNRPNPAGWMQLYSQWATPQTAADTDGDGIPDSGALPITEQTLGTSQYSTDTDGDGLSDFDELFSTYHDGTDPTTGGTDTDGDGVGDNSDPFPLYNFTSQIESSDSVNVDGVIGSGEWVEVTHWNGTDSDINATYYARWDGTNLYVAAEVTDDDIDMQFASEDWDDCFEVRIDAGQDGWWLGTGGTHNYRLRFMPRDAGGGECAVYGRDFYHDPPNDALHQIDTSNIVCRHGIVGSTYTIEAMIPASVLPGLTIGTGQTVRITFGVQDFDPGPWEWWGYNAFSGLDLEEPGFIELDLTTGGGGGGTVLTSADFESGFGDWVNVTGGDSHDWTRDSGGTPSSGTGPSSGANASTWYVYLETSSGGANSAGDTAILQGPLIDGTDRELTFYYHMYGSNMGTLNVDVYSGGQWHNGVWSISGQQHTSSGAAYTQAQVDLSGYSGTIRVRFRGVAAGGYRGDMAIDDIEITGGEGGGGDTTPPTFAGVSSATPGDGQVVLSWSAASDPSTPITYNIYRATTSDGQNFSNPLDTTQQLTYTDTSVTNGVTYYYVVRAEDSVGNEDTNSHEEVATPTGGGGGGTVLTSADFESGYGDWVNVTGDDSHDWTRDSGGTPSSGTGPSSGAGGSTWYVYLETSSGGANSAGNTAILQGPEIDGTNRELTFYYHMYGADMGTLNVDVYSSGSWHNGIWSISGQQHTSNGAAYTQAQVDLSGYSGTIRVRFRAVAAGGYQGDMAIDDIEITGDTGGGDTTPPTFGGLESAVAGDGQVSLYWSAASDPSTPITYNVYRATSPGGQSFSTPTFSTPNTSAVDFGVANGITYYYVVRAEDSEGNEETNTIERSATPTGGGGGGNDVEIVGSWTSGTSHTRPSGSNRLLVFTAHAEHNGADANLVSVTYGGQSMTKVIERNEGTSYRAYVVTFVLNEAGVSAATNSTFVVTWAQTPSETPAYSSVFLQNVSQASPTGTPASNGSSSGNTISTSALSTDDGDMVIVAGTCGNTGSYSVNNGFTEAVELTINSADGVAGYKAATGADETPSITHSGANRQVIAGVVVNHD